MQREAKAIRASGNDSVASGNDEADKKEEKFGHLVAAAKSSSLPKVHHYAT
jgi:hypothetical protein